LLRLSSLIPLPQTRRNNRRRRRRGAGKEPTDGKNDDHDPRDHHETDQRALGAILKIINRALHPCPSPVPRSLHLLLRPEMPRLVEMRHVIVESLRKSAGAGARRFARVGRVVLGGFPAVREVLVVTAFRALCAPAAVAEERRRWAFELCPSPREA